MDEFLRSRMRTLGVVTLVVLVVFLIVMFFASYKEKKDAAMKLKLFYSDMTQSIQYSMNVNGPPGDWGWMPGYKNSDLLNGYLVNYLKIKKNCIKEQGDCMPDLYYNSVNSKQTTINLHQLPSVIMSNGSSFAIETVSSCHASGSACAVLYVDLNGKEAPNAFGRDLFVFLIINSDSVAFIPYNARLTGGELTKDEKYGCNKDAEVALYCSALIFANGWSIDKKYPW